MQSGLPGAPAGWTRKIPASSPYPAPDRLPQGKPVRHGYSIPTDIPTPVPIRNHSRYDSSTLSPIGPSLRAVPPSVEAVSGYGSDTSTPGDILAAGGVGRTTHEGCGKIRHGNLRGLGSAGKTRKVSRTRHGAARSSHHKLPIRNPKVSDPNSRRINANLYAFCIPQYNSPQYNFQHYNIPQYNPQQYYLLLSNTHTIHRQTFMHSTIIHTTIMHYTSYTQTFILPTILRLPP